MLKDFKAFIARGNVLDLAIGVIIGAAFGKIVNNFGRRHNYAAHRLYYERFGFQ